MPPASTRLSASSTPETARTHLKSCSLLCSPARAGAGSTVFRETPGRYCSALIEVPGSPTLLARWRVQGNLNLDLSQLLRLKSFELPRSPSLRLGPIFRHLSWSRTLTLPPARVTGMTAFLVLLLTSDTSTLMTPRIRIEDAGQFSTLARVFGVYTLTSSSLPPVPRRVRDLLLTIIELTMLLFEGEREGLNVERGDALVV